MKKKTHDRILREESKKQHLSTVFKSCSLYIFQLLKEFRLVCSLTWF